MGYRLAVDVGGTFTDLLLFNERTGELLLAKTPSTPADPSIGVLTGIHKIADLVGAERPGAHGGRSLVGVGTRECEHTGADLRDGSHSANAARVGSVAAMVEGHQGARGR